MRNSTFGFSEGSSATDGSSPIRVPSLFQIVHLGSASTVVDHTAMSFPSFDTIACCIAGALTSVFTRSGALPAEARISTSSVGSALPVKVIVPLASS